MIGEAVRIIRKRKGLRLQDVAERCGVHPVTISRYERGERVPDDEMLAQIASALNVSVDDIIEESETSEVATPPELGGSFSGLTGKKLKQIRGSSGKTQQELADEIGVHFTAISRWERDRDPIPSDRIAGLAAALGVSESELRGAPAPEQPAEVRTPQVVRTRAAQGEWMAAVIQSVEDRDLAWVLAAIGSLVDPDAWVASITMAQIEEQSGNPEVFRAVWHKVLKSPWLRRIGEGEYTFQLVFPVEEE